MTLPPGDGAEGERRRDDALRRLRAFRALLVRRVQRTFVFVLLDSGPAATDAVRGLVVIPAGTDPRLVGAAVRALATDGIIRRDGWTRSTRPEAHRRDLPVWRIADRAAALAWLATNPDLPDPEQPQQPTLFD